MKIGLFFLSLLVSISAFGQADSLDTRANELLQKSKTQQLSKDELKEVRAYGTNFKIAALYWTKRTRTMKVL
jgi:hypothetical protein